MFRSSLASTARRSFAVVFALCAAQLSAESLSMHPAQALATDVRTAFDRGWLCGAEPCIETSAMDVVAARIKTAVSTAANEAEVEKIAESLPKTLFPNLKSIPVDGRVTEILFAVDPFLREALRDVALSGPAVEKAIRTAAQEYEQYHRAVAVANVLMNGNAASWEALGLEKALRDRLAVIRSDRVLSVKEMRAFATTVKALVTRVTQAASKIAERQARVAPTANEIERLREEGISLDAVAAAAGRPALEALILRTSRPADGEIARVELVLVVGKNRLPTGITVDRVRLTRTADGIRLNAPAPSILATVRTDQERLRLLLDQLAVPRVLTREAWVKIDADFKNVRVVVPVRIQGIEPVEGELCLCDWRSAADEELRRRGRELVRSVQKRLVEAFTDREMRIRGMTRPLRIGGVTAAIDDWQIEPRFRGEWTIPELGVVRLTFALRDVDESVQIVALEHTLTPNVETAWVARGRGALEEAFRRWFPSLPEAGATLEGISRSLRLEKLHFDSSRARYEGTLVFDGLGAPAVRAPLVFGPDQPPPDLVRVLEPQLRQRAVRALPALLASLGAGSVALDDLVGREVEMLGVKLQIASDPLPRLDEARQAVIIAAKVTVSSKPYVVTGIAIERPRLEPGRVVPARVDLSTVDVAGVGLQGFVTAFLEQANLKSKYVNLSDVRALRDDVAFRLHVRVPNMPINGIDAGEFRFRQGFGDLGPRLVNAVVAALPTAGPFSFANVGTLRSARVIADRTRLLGDAPHITLGGTIDLKLIADLPFRVEITVHHDGRVTVTPKENAREWVTALLHKQFPQFMSADGLLKFGAVKVADVRTNPLAVDFEFTVRVFEAMTTDLRGRVSATEFKVDLQPTVTWKEPIPLGTTNIFAIDSTGTLDVEKLQLHVNTYVVFGERATAEATRKAVHLKGLLTVDFREVAATIEGSLVLFDQPVMETVGRLNLRQGTFYGRSSTVGPLRNIIAFDQDLGIDAATRRLETSIHLSAAVVKLDGGLVVLLTENPSLAVAGRVDFLDKGLNLRMEIEPRTFKVRGEASISFDVHAIGQNITISDARLTLNDGGAALRFTALGVSLTVRSATLGGITLDKIREVIENLRKVDLSKLPEILSRGKINIEIGGEFGGKEGDGGSETTTAGDESGDVADPEGVSEDKRPTGPLVADKSGDSDGGPGGRVGVLGTGVSGAGGRHPSQVQGFRAGDYYYRFIKYDQSPVWHLQVYKAKEFVTSFDVSDAVKAHLTNGKNEVLRHGWFSILTIDVTEQKMHVITLANASKEPKLINSFPAPQWGVVTGIDFWQAARTDRSRITDADLRAIEKIAGRQESPGFAAEVVRWPPNAAGGAYLLREGAQPCWKFEYMSRAEDMSAVTAHQERCPLQLQPKTVIIDYGFFRIEEVEPLEVAFPHVTISDSTAERFAKGESPALLARILESAAQDGPLREVGSSGTALLFLNPGSAVLRVDEQAVSRVQIVDDMTAMCLQTATETVWRHIGTAMAAEDLDSVVAAHSPHGCRVIFGTDPAAPQWRLRGFIPVDQSGVVAFDVDGNVLENRFKRWVQRGIFSGKPLESSSQAVRRIEMLRRIFGAVDWRGTFTANPLGLLGLSIRK